MTKLSTLTVGVEHTIVCQVGEQHMVRRLLPDVAEFVRKPEVMASGWLVGMCEWPAMEALREHISESQCSLGTRMSISHLAPIPAGATLWITARCTRVDGSFSEWAVQARDECELVATGTVAFVVVELDRFVRQKVAPKRARLERNGMELELIDKATATVPHGADG